MGAHSSVPASAATRTSKELSTVVADLNTSSIDDDRSKAILAVGLEFLEAFRQMGDFKKAAKLCADIESHLDKNLGKMENDQTFLIPMGNSTSNPDLKMLYMSIEQDLRAPDKPIQLVSHGKSPFPNVNSTRNMGTEAFNYLVVAAHRDSEYLNNIELFRRALRRILIYFDVASILPKNEDINEFFTQDRIFFAAYCFIKIFPDAILPSQWEVLQNVSASIQSHNLEDFRAGRLRNWAGQNLSIASSMIHAGLLFDNREWLDAGMAILHLHEREQFPDGGLAYYRGQNESTAYHAVNVDIACRIYLTSGSEIALRLVIKAEHFTLLSVEPVLVANFHTDPAWKWNWNSSYSTPKPTAYFTRNPFLKTYQEVRSAYASSAAARKAPPLASLCAVNAMMDLSPVVSRPLPDRYFVYDANIQGVRGRYGRFSTALVGRRVETPVGLHCMATAMAVDPFDPARPCPLNAAFLSFAGPRLRSYVRPEQAWTAVAHTAGRCRGAAVVGQGFAALMADYQLCGQSFGPSTWASTWRGEQLWLALPGRMVGLIGVRPGPEPAYEVSAVVRLHYGAAGALYPKRIITLDKKPANHIIGHDAQICKAGLADLRCCLGEGDVESDASTGSRGSGGSNRHLSAGEGQLCGAQDDCERDFEYGDMLIRIVDENYDGGICLREKAPILRCERTLATEIVIHDRESRCPSAGRGNAQGSLRKYTRPMHHVVECAHRDVGLLPPGAIDWFESGSVVGLRISRAVSTVDCGSARTVGRGIGGYFAALHNRGSTAVNVRLAEALPSVVSDVGKTWMHRGFVEGAANAPTTAAANIVLGAGEGLVLVAGKEAGRAPFASFERMMELFENGLAEGLKVYALGE